MKSEQTKSKWLTPQTLEDEYGIKKSTQAKLRMKKILKYHKIGGKFIWYLRETIDDLIMLNVVTKS